MTEARSAGELINKEVTSWLGVSAGTGSRGEYAFTVAGREIGHLHGDSVAHFMFPKAVGQELKRAGRVIDHPVFPGKPGPAARAIYNDQDVRDVIELMRINYERVTQRSSSRGAAKTTRV